MKSLNPQDQESYGSFARLIPIQQVEAVKVTTVTEEKRCHRYFDPLHDSPHIQNLASAFLIFHDANIQALSCGKHPVWNLKPIASLHIAMEESSSS